MEIEVRAFEVVNGDDNVTHQDAVPASGAPNLRKMIDPHITEYQITVFCHLIPP